MKPKPSPATQIHRLKAKLRVAISAIEVAAYGANFLEKDHIAKVALEKIRGMK